MVAGFWFRRMSVRDSLRTIGPGGIPVFLLLPGPFALVPMTLPVGVTLLALTHGLALAETIAPTFGVARVLEVTGHVFPELAGDRTGRLPATAATVVVAIGEGGWITPGDQVFVGGFAATEQHQYTQYYRAPHLDFQPFNGFIRECRSTVVDEQ